MKFQIKQFKHFLRESSTFQYLIAFYKIFIVDKNFKILFNQTEIKKLGNFKIKINIFNKDELRSLYYDLDYIHGLRYFIEKKPNIYIYSTCSNLIYNFFSKTLKCKTFVLNDNLAQTFHKNKNLILLSRNKFLYSIKKNMSKKNNILISENNNNPNLEKYVEYFDYIFLRKQNISFNKKFNLYFYDRYGKVNEKNRGKFNEFFLYSKNKILTKNNQNNLISGIACLKNLDLYPFDICFESALGLLDELVIGIDKQSFNNKYQKLLNKFLNQTKFRKKIKLIFLNFNSNTTNTCSTRGRWIADVFNILSDQCKNENIMICGADELFEINLKKNINKKILKLYDEIKFQFIHFVFNFNLIRDPKYASYNSWHRIVKREKYISNHDGMGFRKNDNLYPLKTNTDTIVFHIGYVMNYQKKIKTHMNKKTGVFGNLYSKKKYLSLIKPIPVEKKIRKRLFKTLENFKYMDGYKILNKIF